jgi:NADH-quinone oxidoreductase subunit F
VLLGVRLRAERRQLRVPLGTKFHDLLEMAGGLRPGRTLKGAIPGGVSMPVLTAAELKDLPMDYDTIRALGSGLGSGAIVVLDDSVCCVKFACRISQFFHKESCGQCTPCREGTGWMHRVLERIVAGKATMEDLHQLKAVAGQIEGHTICAFGEAAAWPIQGFLRQFWDEFEYYIVNGHSMVDGKRWRQPPHGAQPVNPSVPPDHVTIEIDGKSLVVPKGR